LNLVDSSGWLEYFADGPNASSFEKAFADPATILVPTICLYEVFKVVLREKGEDAAFQAVALMSQGHLIDLTPEIAIQAAKTSLDEELPMADSIILATGRTHGAMVWTQDEDFKDLPGVKYFKKG
jgi:toxin FitB